MSMVIKKGLGKVLVDELRESINRRWLALSPQQRIRMKAWTQGDYFAGDTSSISSIQPISILGTRLPFYSIHPVSGSVFCYGDLARALGLDQPFYAFQSVGLNEHMTPHKSIEMMAAYYLDALIARQPQGPYYIGGWSFGGIVAFELAQQLRRQGRLVGLLALMDSWLPATTLVPFAWDRVTVLMGLVQELRPLTKLDQATFYTTLCQLEEAEQLLQVCEHLLPDNSERRGNGAEEINKLVRTVEANLYALQIYKPKEYLGKVTFFKAAEQLTDNLDHPVVAWEKLAIGVETEVVPGNHYSMIKEPHVDKLAGLLAKHLLAVSRDNCK